jgi:hypothetical protein
MCPNAHCEEKEQNLAVGLLKHAEWGFPQSICDVKYMVGTKLTPQNCFWDNRLSLDWLLSNEGRSMYGSGGKGRCKCKDMKGRRDERDSERLLQWPWTVYFFIFFYLVYEAIGTAATPGLLFQPRVIMKMIVESMMECRLAGETEVLGENLPKRHFCPSQNPTCPPGFAPGPPRWEAGD